MKVIILTLALCSVGCQNWPLGPHATIPKNPNYNYWDTDIIETRPYYRYHFGRPMTGKGFWEGYHFRNRNLLTPQHRR
jgi:hypothetical protein